jgi:hypothetical protein
MKDRAIHTSDAHRADRYWLLLGGRIEPVRRTGEKRYSHHLFDHPLRTNGRRTDVPAKLLSRINQLMKMRAANDERWCGDGDAEAHTAGDLVAKARGTPPPR